MRLNMNKWVIGKIFKIIKWKEYLFSIILHAPIANFIAGQYAKLALNINGKKIQRAYSYVNSPDNKNLEFYLVNIPNGKLSEKLFSLKKNNEIMISKNASGFFTIKTIPKCKHLWMLATGTAIGPYLSILQDFKNLIRFEKIILVHAVRFSSDFNYLPLIKKIQKKFYKNLIIQTVTSREETLNSLKGRLPKLIENGDLENSVGLSIKKENSHVMLCGNPDMVKDTKKILEKTKNMKKNLKNRPGTITMENYW